MAKKIFINLPVADLQKATAFYTAIGFTNNPQFTDETGAGMVLTEEIYVMLLTHPKFNQFTKKEVGDTLTTASVINTLAVDSIEEMNTMVRKAVEAGGTEPDEARDYGFMQQRGFEDPDGHLWGVIYVDMAKVPKQ
jgi:predicted lactoylglutathione lyase